MIVSPGRTLTLGSSKRRPHSTSFFIVSTSFLRCLREAALPWKMVSSPRTRRNKAFFFSMPLTQRPNENRLVMLSEKQKNFQGRNHLHPATGSLCLPSVTINSWRTLASPIMSSTSVGGRSFSSSSRKSSNSR